jgi:thiol-disulfide isomerase/thioredoxin
MTIATLQNPHLNRLSNLLQLACWLALPMIALTTSSVCAAEVSSQPVIHLVNNGFLPGQLLNSERPGMLRWQSRLFTKPFVFPLSAVATAQFPLVLPRPKPAGEYCVELSGGDVLYGDILQLSESTLNLQAANVGTIHVKRADVHRIYRWKETALIYLGPNGLNDWTQSIDGKASEDIWTSEGGWPQTNTANASLFGDFGLPARTAIEFELSWNDRPDFELVLGQQDLINLPEVKGQEIKLTQASDEFRFEVWDGELVVMGESARDADMATVTPIASGPGAVRVQLYLDQEKQRLSIFTRDGRQKASLKLHSKKPLVRPGLRLTNRKGHIRLTHLRIAHWDGILPQDVQVDKSRIHQTDGKIIYGQITGFDSTARTFTLQNDSSTIEVDAATVADVFLSPILTVGPPTAPVPTTQLLPTEKPPTAQDTTDPPAGSKPATPDAPLPAEAVVVLRVTCHDGSQFSGRLTGIQNGIVLLACPEIDEPLRLPLAATRSIGHQTSGKRTSFVSTVSGREGRLEIDGLKLPGRLVDGTENSDASCLVWHPDYSANSSPLARELSGRIVYRDPPKPKPVAAKPAQNGRLRAVRLPQRKPAIQGFGDAFKKMLLGKVTPAKKPRIRAAQTLHLRSGDTIPCDVVSVDEDGLYFTTPLSNATFVSNERIKGVELDGRSGSPALDETKRKRLLTLPRLQKGSPPTHLIYSTSGDFLRGRLSAMSDQTLTIEVRLADRTIPRERVSQIIWLHADEMETVEKSGPADDEKTEPADDVDTISIATSVGADPPDAALAVSDLNNDPADGKGDAPKATAPVATRVQTIIRNTDRLTFFADKVEAATLTGTSDILGECRSELADIDQLLFGDYIERAAAKIAYHRWKLHYATEPKFVLAGSDDAGGRPINGTESPLVGEPAPDFTASTLAGDIFKLSDHRGEIILLDFWATWCLPCLKTMPLVDEIVREFPDQKVRLIAVNMEEQPTEIKSTLERHKLNVPVVLDIDGVAAARYAVTSIPQTVVIDRDGNIARLFVGGGPKLVEPLRQALIELTKTEPPAEDDGKAAEAKPDEAKANEDPAT